MLEYMLLPLTVAWLAPLAVAALLYLHGRIKRRPWGWGRWVVVLAVALGMLGQTAPLTLALFMQPQSCMEGPILALASWAVAGTNLVASVALLIAVCVIDRSYRPPRRSGPLPPSPMEGLEE